MTGVSFLANAFWFLIATLLICLAIIIIAVTIYALVQMKNDAFQKKVEAEKKELKRIEKIKKQFKK